MTLAKSLRVSFAKVADTLLGLPLAVIAVARETCDGDRLPEKFDKAGCCCASTGRPEKRAVRSLGLGLSWRLRNSKQQAG